MKTKSCLLFPHKETRLLLLAFGLLVILSTLLLANPAQVFADAGGWPTATPTLTATMIVVETDLPTAEPTSSLLTFPPTPTFTSVVPAFAEGQLMPEVQVATPAPEPSRINFLTCLPFVAIFFLIAVVGIIWLRARIRQNI